MKNRRDEISILWGKLAGGIRKMLDRDFDFRYLLRASASLWSEIELKYSRILKGAVYRIPIMKPLKTSPFAQSLSLSGPNI